MVEQMKQVNWKMVLLIVLFSSYIGFKVDVYLNFNNLSFLVTLGIGGLLAYIFRKDIWIESKKPSKPIKPIRSEKFNIIFYKIWSYIGLYLATMLVWSLIGLSLKQLDVIAKYYNHDYIAITITTIIMSVLGDKVLYWWFRIQNIKRIFKYKEHLVNQNNVRFYIYFCYFVLLFLSSSGLIYESTQLWINTFATYVAFDRIRSNWDLLRNNEFSV